MFATKLSQTAFSTVGALAISAACLFAAAGPVRAETMPASPDAWAHSVERRIDQAAHLIALDNVKAKEAVVALDFTPTGEFAGAQLVGTTGNKMVDRSVVRMAKSITYPTLPAAMRAANQPVEMRIAMKVSDGPATTIRYARTNVGSVKLAAR